MKNTRPIPVPENTKKPHHRLSPITVTASVALTATQAELLRFLADQGGAPRVVRPKNYAALRDAGLVYFTEEPARFHITDLGRATVELLNRE